VTGAADGFARMAQDPAVTLLHCGPGLANGLSNLHNARRARSAVVNIVGDQASYHRSFDPPLTADTEGWARGVSAWTRTAASAATIARDAAVAIQAARSAPGQIATLIAPADTCWDEGGIVADMLWPPAPAAAPPHHIRETAQLLRRDEPALLLLGGGFIDEASIETAAAIAEATGARIMVQAFNGRVARGRGRVPIERLPYNVDQAIQALAGIRHLILAGASAPGAPFAYPGKPGALYPEDATIHVLARAEHDLDATLAALAEELGARRVPVVTVPLPEAVTSGAISADAVARTLSAMLPENAIIVDESVSFGRPFFNGLAGAAPHDWLQITGGATGAAVAAPHRRVVALQADGAGMFTVQSLWTQAREHLPVTSIVLSNRKYQILLGELANVGANPGRTALDMLDIGRPDIDWVGLSRSLGVDAARAETMEQFVPLLEAANRSDGPFLIELMT
jgi:acetolactate synthase-1/2/3 large subunit